MIYNDIKHIIKQFAFQGKYISAEELTSGNINSTYLLTDDQHSIGGKSHYCCYGSFKG